MAYIAFYINRIWADKLFIGTFWFALCWAATSTSTGDAIMWEGTHDFVSTADFSLGASASMVFKLASSFTSPVTAFIFRSNVF